MLGPNEDGRNQDQDSQKFCPGDLTLHNDKYPFIEEFSDFIASVSTKALEGVLMTPQQKQLAKAVWEAENYGGSEAKCAARLKEIYGNQWREMTSIREHMTPIRDYYEYVLILDHQRQWEQRKKLAKLP